LELPTYTNIWKIEKRLYKLYDFRLPMPVPISQVAAFLAIAIPYTLILTLVGMPFSHSWVWLYVLPPAVLAWLVTRPVLEGKRLPELVLSQLRYLTEPRTWCRLAPLEERDQINVVARIWRRPQLVTMVAADLEAGAANADAAAAWVRPAWPDQPAVRKRAREPRLPAVRAAHAPSDVAGPVYGTASAAAESGDAVVRTDADESKTPERRSEAGTAAPAAGVVRLRAVVVGRSASERASAAGRSPAIAPQSEPARSGPAQPAVTVRTDALAERPLRMVERALRTPAGGRAGGWHDRVVVVPGGHRPGKPDHVQRDQARARAPLAGPARIVILGTTGGAGQTVTTLLAGQLLASLRGEAVAVLDLCSGPGALTGLARAVPRLLPSRRMSDQAAAAAQPGTIRERGLQVVTADSGAEPHDAGELIEAVVARYPLTLADPAAADVPRALGIADQLVLVTPSGAEAAGSLAMTLEWLEAHGHSRLARAAVIVLNGVSEQTAEHAERAAMVAAGRCRAIVRVPWDAGMAGGGQLSAAAVRAYTALAGVLIAGLADRAQAGSAPAGSVRR
jgi:TcpE family